MAPTCARWGAGARATEHGLAEAWGGGGGAEGWGNEQANVRSLASGG